MFMPTLTFEREPPSATLRMHVATHTLTNLTRKKSPLQTYSIQLCQLQFFSDSILNFPPQAHSNILINKFTSTLLHEVLIKLALLLVRVIAATTVTRALVERLSAVRTEVIYLACMRRRQTKSEKRKTNQHSSSYNYNANATHTSVRSETRGGLN